MARALSTFRTGDLPGAALRLAHTALRLAIAACTRRQDEGRDRAGPLDVATLRDIGVRRAYQDYARDPCPGRCLHALADRTRCGL